MNKHIKVKLVFLVILCFVLMCGFTSNKGGVSGISGVNGVETVNFTYMTDKSPKGGEVLLTIYESKGNTKYSGFVTSDGTRSQIKTKVSAEPLKSNIKIIGLEWYNCHALVNITPECKEKLDKGQLRIEIDPNVIQKSENIDKKETNKIVSAIIIGIIGAFVLSKLTEEREKEG